MIVLIALAALCAASCKSSKSTTQKVQQHHEVEKAERREWRTEEEHIGELEVNEETMTVTIHGTDTTTEIQRRQTRLKGAGKRLEERQETVQEETIENNQEMATEKEERQHGRREDGVGLTRIAIGAGTCLLLILLPILNQRRKK